VTNILTLCEENQTNAGLRENVERRCRLPAGALHERRTVLDSMVRPVLALPRPVHGRVCGPGATRTTRATTTTMSWTIAPALPRTPPWRMGNEKDDDGAEY
jgi:hypothetical protein